jgi:hypothetical protein
MWASGEGQHTVYVTDRLLKDRLIRLGCRLHCVHFNRDFRVAGWDLLVPKTRYRRAVRLVRPPARARRRSRHWEAS